MTPTLQMTDGQLNDAVGAELDWTPNVNSVHIGVAVDKGAVTLSGEVDSYPEKVSASKATMRVHGVTAVADELTVRSTWGKRNDADVAREVSDALERAVNVPDEVQAVVRDQFVTLSGRVTWHYEREAAERAVRYLKGVRGVSDTVTIHPKTSAVDLRQAITAALVRSAELDSARMTVTADGGTVTLDGSVSTWGERVKAGAAAWSAPGVTNVTNNLAVRG